MSPYEELEKQLWRAADELRANSHLNSSQYSAPVLGLIFLRYADYKFSVATKADGKEEIRTAFGGQNRLSSAGCLVSAGEIALFIFDRIAGKTDIGKEINEAMKLIEKENDNLRDVLPKNYHQFENSTLVELIKTFNSIPMDIEGDAFGRIYEYFLGEFAMDQGQGGGEFYTPTSIVKLIVEILEPYHGRILDPACGSGGMFVQSAKFVANHKKRPQDEMMAIGFEKTEETVRLAKMNLAVHGLEGEIKRANSYYDEEVRGTIGQFDFVMANPPFNVNNIDKERLKGDKRFPFGLPNVDNGNYIWIQLFYSALHNKGRAGFVMANSATDARSSEMEIRRQLIQAGDVDVIVSVGSNFFYTVTLPCTLWFFNKNKNKTLQKGTVLFLDLREIFTQVDRAHREFSPEQIEFIANIVHLYRGEPIETPRRDVSNNVRQLETTEPVVSTLLQKHFPKMKYRDVAGLCKTATIKEIEEQDWSLNPGRYVGVTEKKDDGVDFGKRLKELNTELEQLNTEAEELQKTITKNVKKLL